MARSRTNLAVRKIQDLLTRAAKGGPVPDYASFGEAMAPLLESERASRVSTVHPEAPSYLVAATMLLLQYHVKFEKGGISPMDFRRYKLLQHLFMDGGRSEQMARAILTGRLPEEPTLDSDGATGAQLRVGLLVAIDRGEYEDASFLLGRLDESDHDPGERAYLQALAAFASGNPALPADRNAQSRCFPRGDRIPDRGR